jgi:hypothetical protein
MNELPDKQPTREDFGPTNFLLVLTGEGRTPALITWAAFLDGICPFTHWQKINAP